jgi:hypothetical protein
LASEKCWRKGNKKETRDGDKQFYKCKFIKSSGCSAKCFLLYHNDEDGVSHYKTENNHNDHICENKHGIMSKYTEAIDSIYEVFHKPKEIKRQLLKIYPKDANYRKVVKTNIVERWYKERDEAKPFSKFFADKVSIDHKLWVQSFHLSIDDRPTCYITDKQKKKTSFMSSGHTQNGKLLVTENNIQKEVKR